MVILALLLSCGVFALDLTVSGGAGNLSFGDERLSSLGQQHLSFSPSLYPLGSVMIDGDHSRFISFHGGFERDALLKNRVITNIALYLKPIKVEIGPFMGVFNTPKRPINPGFSATLGLEFPGILFGSVHAASTIGTGLRVPGDYVQKTGFLDLGFWVPHVICAFGVHTKNFTQQKDRDLVIEDEQIRYQFTGDIFTKNAPYTIRVNLGYQELRRSYTTLGNTQRDELHSVFIGLELTYMVRSTLGFFLGGEMPVYSWGEKPLKGPDPRVLLFQAHGGFTWTLPGGW